MDFQRASGVLLHPTSLPGPYGIGDIGPAAHRWVDFLHESRTHIWQVLPLGPTGYGDSPYQCFSAFAGNPYLISFDLLVDQGLCEQEMLIDQPEFDPARVDYGALIPWKLQVLEKVVARFESGSFPDIKRELDRFKDTQGHWLSEYVLFMALKEEHNGRPWWEWDAGFGQHNEEALAKARVALQPAIARHEFYQFLFFQQWTELRRYAASKDVKIIGDIPIFVAHDSADVWAQPHLFLLDDVGSPTVVAGVPPDYFSPTGQLWGNPLYDWETHAAEGYQWWEARFRSVLEMVDIIRLDHFRGFAAAWEVPAGEQTAEHGKWVRGPGSSFFEQIETRLGNLPIIAEDLGVITPDVVALREEFNLPGMKVLVFAFDAGPKNPFLPHNHRKDNVVYTGTHDNDTTLGWYRRVQDDERGFFHEYLAYLGDEPNWELIRSAWASVAVFAVTSVQDLIGLDNTARMNYPSRPSGNWQWRLQAGMLQGGIKDRLAHLNQVYRRDGWADPEKPVEVPDYL